MRDLKMHLQAEECRYNYRSNQGGIFKTECVMANGIFTAALIKSEYTQSYMH